MEICPHTDYFKWFTAFKIILDKSLGSLEEATSEVNVIEERVKDPSWQLKATVSAAC